MATIRTVVIGSEPLQRALERLRPDKSAEITTRVLRTVALRTQTVAAQDKMIRGGTQAPVKGKLTSRTGTGRRSIGTNFAPLPHAAEVGSDLGYMAMHELGGTVTIPAHSVAAHTRTVVFGRTVSPFKVPSYQVRAHRARFPRRPWLEPAVDEVVLKAPEIAARIWESVA